MHTAASSLCDTASLSMRVPLIRSPGADSHVFIDRIYQICNNVHPGMAIETDAVHHIRELLELIITDLLEQRPHTVVEMDRLAQKLFPKGLHSITREAWDMMHNYAPPRKLSKSAAVKQALMIQNKLAILIKENLGFREKEKREREREKDKEIERMAVYILSVCESLTEDILRRTGNYVKNIRNAENKITLHDLKISLNGDRALMELNFKLNNEDEALNESSSPGGFLSNFHDFDPFDGVEGQPPKTPGLTPTSPVAAHFSMPSQVVATYESVANEFLKDERSYLRELNRINIFRRRLESVAGEDTKALLRVLCGNLADIHELTMKVERTLEDAIEMSDAPTVGMGLWDLAEALEFNAYLTYIARETDDSDSEELLSPAIDRIINQILNSPVFASLFGSEDRYDNSSLDGSSFRLTVKYVLPHLLHLPILHFFRYVEYVNRLLRLTSSEDDRDELKNCRVELSKVKSALEQRCQELPDLKANIQASIEALNRNDSPICQVKRLKAIQESIDGFIGDSIAKKCSELIKEGDVHILRPSLTFSPEILRKSGWKTERHIFLFDQLVVMCKKHKTLKFKERLSVQWIDVVDIENDGDLQHAFRLDYRERSTSRSFTIICKTEDEKKQWMGVFVKATTRSVLDRILDNYLKEEEKRIPLVLPSPEQYKFAEPDNEENISFEDYTTSSGIPVIKTGTVVKLIERLTYHQYTDNKFVQTFLISYRSFCTPSELLNMLIERFYVPVPQRLQNQQEMRGGPLAGRYDTVQSHGLSGTNLHSPHSEQSFQRFRKEYERPIQLRVLNVMNQWVKCHWYDFDNDRELLLALQKFLQKSMEPSQKLTNQHRKFCKLILTAIDKRLNQLAEKDKPQDGHVNTAFVYGEEQLNASLNTSLNGSFNGASTPGPTGIASTPLSAGNSSASRTNGTTTNSFQPKKPEVVWHTARKGDFANYDLLTLHPLEIGRQLTLLHFDLYRAIKPIELVGAAWTKHDKYRKSPQLLKLTDHSTLLTYWVSRSIVETESLEERVAMLNRALDVMSVFEELHNFTGLVAFLSALNSSCVHRLSWCWNRLDNEKQKSYDRFVTLCEPRWQEMQKRLQTINPPCVPFFGHYLSSIFFFEAGNSTFVKSPGVKDMKTPESTTVDGQSPTAHNRRVLVSFLKCRRISELIREIQMYQNQPYSLQLEPSIRQFFESINPKSDFDDDNDALETYLYNKSLKIQPKDAEKPAKDVKPRHPPHVLKSPGIKSPHAKPTLSNHYSSSGAGSVFSTSQSHVHPSVNASSHGSPHPGPIPSPPAFPAPLSPADAAAAAAHSLSSHSDRPPGKEPQHFTFSDGASSLSRRYNKIPPLQPPPLHPRPPRPTPTTSSYPLTLPGASPLSKPPSQRRPPPPIPVAAGSVSGSPIAKSKSPAGAMTGSSASTPGDMPQSAFVFPNVDTSAIPPLPPRPNNNRQQTPTEQDQLRVTLDSRSSSESHSPTVCLSVPLPPPLHPRGAFSSQAPPPLPPKTRYSSSADNSPLLPVKTCSITPGSATSSSNSASPTATSPAPLPAASTQPPALPPKTYKTRKASGSPSESSNR